MKLTDNDYKLITYMYHNFRQPVTKIAKACGLSRDQVNYKLNKYISEELITGFKTFFDYSKLGYNRFLVILIKFDKYSQYETFSKNLSKNKNCVSYGKVFGKYDLWINMIFKDEYEFNDSFLNMMADKKYSIYDYSVLRPSFNEAFPLKFAKSHENNFTFLKDSSEKVKLDNKDKIILKCLEKNAREKLIDIADKAGISPELVSHRIKRMEREGLITGSRILFNMKKFGYHYSEIFLTFKYFTPEIKEKIRQFSKSSKHVHNLIFFSSKPNCMVQLFHREHSELEKTVQEIRELFSEEMFDLDIMLLGEDEYINTLPFL